LDKYATFVEVIILQSIKSQECGHIRITYPDFIVTVKIKSLWFQVCAIW